MLPMHIILKERIGIIDLLDVFYITIANLDDVDYRLI